MCQCCQALQAARDKAEAPLEAKIREHGGSIPTGHSDMAFFNAARELREAFRESYRRHAQEAEHPTCAVCDRPASAYDKRRDAMFCEEHAAGEARP